MRLPVSGPSSDLPEEVKGTPFLQAKGEKQNNETALVAEESAAEIVSIATTDVDVYKSKASWPKSWLSHLNVSLVDKETLTSHDAWLSDAIINAAQTLLKSDNPFLSGLQNVNLGLTGSYAVETGEFIQILHNGCDHCNVISTIGVKHPIVNIFDSLYYSCTIHTKLQIAGLLSSPEPAIKLQYMDVQKLLGKADCGLFAVAFAVTLADAPSRR